MLLAIDIGNSNIAFGIYAGSWQNHWRLHTVTDKTSDEYEVLFRSLIVDSGYSLEDIDQVVISNVVPLLNQPFKRLAHHMFAFDPLMVTAGIETGLTITIDHPLEIGSDLLANAVAGFDKYHSNCIIVDFGTALTMTIVGSEGELLGVSIAPGLRSAMKALSSNTSQLPFVQLEVPPSVIGKHTTHAIQSGVIFGYVGLVESLVKKIKTELGGSAKVIATGGLAEVIAPLTDHFDTLEPWLTLEGLRLIAEKNKYNRD